MSKMGASLGFLAYQHKEENILQNYFWLGISDFLYRNAMEAIHGDSDILAYTQVDLIQVKCAWKLFVLLH